MSAKPSLTLAGLLERCVALGASDLHLVPHMQPVLRVHGAHTPLVDLAVLSHRDVEALCGELLQWSGRVGLDATGSQDGALTGSSGARFRFNVFRRLGGLAAAVRRLEERFRGLAELGLPVSLYSLCDHHDGLVALAGPTGAGKSTTLAALIDHINRTSARHIVTIEDPIEYVHAAQRSIVNQRQVGSDASSFHDALVASLREDPDVILVGEVRDLDTIRTAIRAAETGHLVFTTVHAGDTVGAIERLVSVFPADEQAGIRQQLALVLRAVVAQRLLPKMAQSAGAPRSSPHATGERIGRVVACEVLIGTPAVSNLIATGRSVQLLSAIESGGPHGMQTMEQDLARLVLSGRVTEESASLAARSQAVLRERVAQLRRNQAVSGGSNAKR